MAPDRRAFLRGATGGAVGALGLLTGVTVAGSLVDRGPGAPSVLVAGSLQGVASEVGGAAVEAHGSVAVRRLVLEGARDPDAVALADPRLFDGLVERVVLFATNALALAYDPDSPFADDLRSDWAEAVADPAIALGRTDPALDPLGYRTVMALRLAAPLGVDAASVLERSTVLPETGLMRALEGGELDAAFAYRNMAVEHDVPRIDLPASIDFSDPARAERYATVSVELDGRTVPGAPIVYGAAALAPAGEPWVERLSTARGTLAAAGFTVPPGYPTERPLGDLF